MKKLTITLLSLFISILILAQEKSGLTPWDVANMEYVPYAFINDNGTKVAYLLSEQADPTKENISPSSKLYVYDVESGSSIPFITDGSIRNIRFRPKHESITFTSKKDDDENTSLYEISLKGGEAQKIFEYKTSISRYDWSPNGEKIAFIAKEKTTKSKSPYQPEIYEENLVFSYGFIKEIGNENEAIKIKLEGSFRSIKWSPDTKKLAISVTPKPLIDDWYMRQKINIINSSDFSVVSVVDHSGKLGYFDWSPDGKHIAMIAGADINDPTSGRIKVAVAKTGKTESLAPNFLGKFSVFSWIDKNNIQFLASEGVYITIGSINIESKVITKTIDKGNIAFDDFHRSNNGTLALVGTTTETYYELYLLKNESTKVERITNSNPWLSDRALGKQEVITYKAKDGLEIQGLLIHPVNEEKGKKYPLITVVHGGPESHYTNGWITAYSRPGQMVAAKGYAVFYPNYRGSTGYGEKFAKTSQGDPAGLEFEDILDGIDYLIETGLVDKDRVGVTGGSYGGYATAWFSTKYSERFAAGVMFVGISNTISGWGNSDIPTEHFHVHYLKHIWDDFDFFWDRSPIKHVGNAKIPLLIMAGKGDTRVDPGQSLELYRHIKTRTETPVRLVFYPEEGHGNRKATARYDYSLRMMRWFDTFLMNPGTEIPENKLEEFK